jgi:hypothetical protein
MKNFWTIYLASRKQSKANTLNKLKLQNSTIEAVWLFIGICVSK